MTTSFWQLLERFRIEIPVVQRDYAQGRNIGVAPSIRKNFLGALHAGITTKGAPLELDFVYGYILDGKFIPLDGQQRLTTLFLLHWYMAVKEHRSVEAKDRLRKFTYQTRHSSRLFCEALAGFVPDDLDSPIESKIIDQPWFFSAWKNDATISAMLVMLNDIQKKFSDIHDGWTLLTSESPRIVFHLLSMDELGLPDELYIKMNSRGKELTPFEHFKSRFPGILPAKYVDGFQKTIDGKWSDLFWNLCKDQGVSDSAKLTDGSFLRMFRFLTNVVIWENQIDTEEGEDEFLSFEKVYRIEQHVGFVFSCLDLFTENYAKGSTYFNSLFYVAAVEFDQAKTRLFFQKPEVDLFRKCAIYYDEANRSNPFSMGEQLLLYACILHLRENTTEFWERVRRVRNLIANSDDAIRRENMPSLLFTVSEIIRHGRIDDASKFSKAQAEEEARKRLRITENAELRETLYKLEDHELLQGCISIVGLDKSMKPRAECFHRVFNDNFDCELVSQALLTFGDHSQKYGKAYFQYGNGPREYWRELFTPSQRRLGFSETKRCLGSLLDYLIVNPKVDLGSIVTEYLHAFVMDPERPKDWIYYFVRYPEFRENGRGFYYWPENAKPYAGFMMNKSTVGGFYWSPFLYAIKSRTGDSVHLDNYGAPLRLTKDDASISITAVNKGYKLDSSNQEGAATIVTLHKKGIVDNESISAVQQNEGGIDTEDRVEKGLILIIEILKC